MQRPVPCSHPEVESLMRLQIDQFVPNLSTRFPLSADAASVPHCRGERALWLGNSRPQTAVAGRVAAAGWNAAGRVR